ncbi:MAG TPA: tetratricopeptide repeat protein [Myxococcota bacterium]|jgi:tetratricopeptide (TPR) repeat protein
MRPLPPWIEIPRRDLEAVGVHRLPVVYRVGILIFTLGLLAVFVYAFWFEARPEAKSFRYGGGAFVGALLAFLLSVSIRWWDRVETTPEELRCCRPFGSVASVRWPQIDSIRFRPVLQRFDIGSAALSRPIRLEMQLERIEALLMLLGERTMHLEDAAIRPGSLAFDADGIVLAKRRIAFSDVADVRIFSIGGVQRPLLALGAQLRDGSSSVLDHETGAVVERYRRVRRAHRDWAARSDEAAPAPMPDRLPARPSGLRSALLVLVPIVISISVGVIARQWRNPSPREVERGWTLYKTHRYPEAIAVAERYFAKHEPDAKNLPLLHLQASAYRKLGRRDEAIATFERGAPVVRSLDSVQAEPRAMLFYELAALYDANGDTRAAIARLEEGLKLRPYSTMHRALLASWYQDLGERERAEELFREVLEAAPQGSEPYVVAALRLANGSGGDGSASRDPAPLPPANLTRRMAIAVIPINDVDPRIDLAQVCLVIESQLWMPCAVTPPQPLDEDLVLDSERNQYEARRVLGALGSARSKLRAFEPGGETFALGVISRDLFDGDANFVFASGVPTLRVAVLSSHRLLEDLPRYWAPEALAGRRISIQAISAIGNALELGRPVSEHCPLAYPNGVEAFVLKGGALCASERRARDAFLEGLGGERMQFDAVRSAAVSRALQAFLIGDVAAGITSARP